MRASTSFRSPSAGAAATSPPANSNFNFQVAEVRESGGPETQPLAAPPPIHVFPYCGQILLRTSPPPSLSCLPRTCRPNEINRYLARHTTFINPAASWSARFFVVDPTAMSPDAARAHRPSALEPPDERRRGHPLSRRRRARARVLHRGPRGEPRRRSSRRCSFETIGGKENRMVMRSPHGRWAGPDIRSRLALRKPG